MLQHTGALQDNVDRIVANHPLLEELDLPHAHLGDREAAVKVLLASIKPMLMLRLVTLTGNYLSETVLSALHEEVPHVLVVFDDIAEMHEDVSADGDDLEEEDGLDDDGDGRDDHNESDADASSGTDEETASVEDTVSEANSYSDSGTDETIY